MRILRIVVPTSWNVQRSNYVCRPLRHSISTWAVTTDGHSCIASYSVPHDCQSLVDDIHTMLNGVPATAVCSHAYQPRLTGTFSELCQWGVGYTDDHSSLFRARDSDRIVVLPYFDQWAFNSLVALSATRLQRLRLTYGQWINLHRPTSPNYSHVEFPVLEELYIAGVFREYLVPKSPSYPTSVRQRLTLIVSTDLDGDDVLSAVAISSIYVNTYDARVVMPPSNGICIRNWPATLKDHRPPRGIQLARTRYEVIVHCVNDISCPSTVSHACIVLTNLQLEPHVTVRYASGNVAALIADHHQQAVTSVHDRFSALGPGMYDQ